MVMDLVNALMGIVTQNPEANMKIGQGKMTFNAPLGQAGGQQQQGGQPQQGGQQEGVPGWMNTASMLGALGAAIFPQGTLGARTGQAISGMAQQNLAGAMTGQSNEQYRRQVDELVKALNGSGNVAAQQTGIMPGQLGGAEYKGPAPPYSSVTDPLSPNSSLRSSRLGLGPF